MSVSSSVRYSSGLFTVLVALVLITPLCGLLFDCGCTWPWAGLESHCNIHNPDAVHQCPWCVPATAGAVSVGLAVLIGFLLSVKQNKSSHDIQNYTWVGNEQELFVPSFIKRVLVGLIGFSVTAVITGWVSGSVQGYPYFVLLNEWPF